LNFWGNGFEFKSIGFLSPGSDLLLLEGGFPFPRCDFELLGSDFELLGERLRIEIQRLTLDGERLAFSGLL
jgi:hypothetical protein